MKTRIEFNGSFSFDLEHLDDDLARQVFDAIEKIRRMLTQYASTTDGVASIDILDLPIEF